jgi:hypothetical protein
MPQQCPLIRVADGFGDSLAGSVCGSWLAASKLLAQICFVLLAVVVSAGESVEGGKDVRMLQCLFFSSRL